MGPIFYASVKMTENKTGGQESVNGHYSKQLIPGAWLLAWNMQLLR